MKGFKFVAVCIAYFATQLFLARVQGAVLKCVSTRIVQTVITINPLTISDASYANTDSDNGYPTTTGNTYTTSSTPTPTSTSTTTSNNPNPTNVCDQQIMDFSKSSDLSLFNIEYCSKNVQVADGMLQLKLAQDCGTTLIAKQNFTQGRVDVVMKNVPGSGAVTALVLMGPAPSDEIDIEFVGKDPSTVQSMYFVKGQRIEQQAGFHSSSPSSDLAATFHTYSFELTSTAVNWYLDNVLIRSLKKTSDATFPTQAGNLRIGVWDGSNTSGWAGTVDWSTGPKIAYIKSINYKPYC